MSALLCYIYEQSNNLNIKTLMIIIYQPALENMEDSLCPTVSNTHTWWNSCKHKQLYTVY